MKKIVHLISSLSGGGAEKQLFYLCSNLNIKNEYEIHVAFINDCSEVRKELEGNVHFHKLEVSNNYSLLLYFKVYRLLKSISPAIVQSWNLQMDIVTGLTSYFTKFNWVLREPNSSERYPKNIKSKFRTFIAKRATCIVANSQAGLLYWLANQNKKEIVHNGFPVADILSFNHNTKGHKNNYLLFVGRFTKAKNVLNLLKSYSVISKKYTGDLILCGQGYLLNEAKKLVTDLGLEQKVIFKGFCDKRIVWGLMKNADALVLPSYHEGFPNVVIEAMLNECPVILSKSESHLLSFSEKEVQFIEHMNQKEMQVSLEAAVESINSSERIIESMKLAKSLSIEKMVDNYRKIYRDLLI